nr:hypothetical protein [Mycobacterium leprae]
MDTPKVRKQFGKPKRPPTMLFGPLRIPFTPSCLLRRRCPPVSS